MLKIIGIIFSFLVSMWGAGIIGALIEAMRLNAFITEEQKRNAVFNIVIASILTVCNAASMFGYMAA